MYNWQVWETQQDTLVSTNTGCGKFNQVPVSIIKASLTKPSTLILQLLAGQKASSRCRPCRGSLIELSLIQTQSLLPCRQRSQQDCRGDITCTPPAAGSGLTHTFALKGSAVGLLQGGAGMWLTRWLSPHCAPRPADGTSTWGVNSVPPCSPASW